MNWPMPQDFNEAVQNPHTAFSDPELKAGQPVVGPQGLPLPRSGNFADVYQVRTAGGRDWAVKCFTRPVTGLEHRYAQVEQALEKAGLPFTVGFTLQQEGVRVRGRWFPILKMEWVDGLLLNQVLRDQAGNPRVLDALGQMWSRLCRRLRELGIAHADLQHGNVLLVPGSRPGSYGLKLIDYDGMYLPALANTPSGETGHPNYQHPLRAARGVYSPDLDRFPHLVIATAMKALAVLGPGVWERYDNGDNLLFTEEDFRAPASSAVMRDLWQTGHPGLQALVGHLAAACGRPVTQTPWLDQIAPDGIVVPLSPEQADAAARALGFGPPAAPLPVEEVVLVGVPSASEIPDSPFDDEPDPRPRKRRAAKPPAKKSPLVPLAIVAGVLVVAGGGAAALLLSGGKKPAETAGKKADDPPEPEAKKKDRDGPKPNTPKPPDADGPKPPEPVITPPPAAPPGPVDVATLPRLGTRWASGPYGWVVNRLSYTGDGKFLLATTAGSPEVAVLNPASGAATGKFVGHEGPVMAVAPLPGRSAVSIAADQDFALVWDPATGRATAKLLCPAIPGRRPEPFLLTSPDGKYVVSGGTESNNWQPAAVPPPPLAITDAETGKAVATFGFNWGVARFTADSTRLVVAGDKTGRVRVFRLPAGTLESEATAAVAEGLALGVSPDGRHAVYYGMAGPGGKAITVYEVATGRPVRTLAVPQTAGERTGFSPDGKWFAVIRRAPAGTQIVLIDTATWDAAAVAEVGNADGVQWDHSLRFSPDGTALVCPKAGGLIAFDLTRGPVAAVPPRADNPPPPLHAETVGVKRLWSAVVEQLDPEIGPQSFDRTGEYLYLYARNHPRGVAVGFDAATGGPLPPVTGTDLRMAYQIIRTDGDDVAAANGIERTFCFWDPKTGRVTRRIPFPKVPEPLTHLELSPDCKFIAAYCPWTPIKDNTPQLAPFKLFDAATGAELIALNWTGGSVHFTDDSARVLLVEQNGKGRWFKLPSGKPDGEWAIPGVVGGTGCHVRAASGDGRTLVYHSRGGSQEVIDGRTGEVTRVISRSVAFEMSAGRGTITSDGRLFVLCRASRPAGDGLVEVYDSTTGRVVASVKTGDTKVGVRPYTALFAQITADGRRLAVRLPYTRELTVYDLAPRPGPVAATPKPKDPDAKPAVPDEAAVAKAEASVRSVLKDEYAKKLPADKKALANKLLGLAEQTADNPAERYVMLRDARDLAADAADPALAVQAVEALDKWYDVDGDRLKLAALEKIAASSGLTATLKAVAELGLAAADEAAGADDYEAAVKFAQVAATAARKGTVAGGLIEDADARIARMRKGVEAFAALKPAVEKLKAEPDDAAANLAVGKYRCFTQGRWDEGLKHLAKTNNAALKAAADLDAATPRTGVPEIKVADGWWDYAQAAVDGEKRPAEARARYWYARALPGLTGLARAKAEARAGFKVDGVEYRPGVVAEFAAKVPSVLQGKKGRIDQTIDFSAGEFLESGRPLTEVAVKWTGSLVAPRPGRYKLVAATAPNVPEQVRVRVNGKVVFDTVGAKAARRLETVVTLTDKPAAVVVEFVSQNSARHVLKLNWVPPDAAGEEVIPGEAWYHDKKAEAALGK